MCFILRCIIVVMFDLRTIFALMCSILISSHAMNRCLDEKTHFQFHRIKNCHRSTMTIVSLANFRSLGQCLEYAKARGGLAVNFSPPETASLLDEKRGGYFTNCNVLGCPESNVTNLVNDTGYDYYSLYGKLNVLEDTHCVKSVGLFRIFEEKENYTDAIIKCQKIGGDLAHIVTEIRTNSLSEIISTSVKSWFKEAYVGLDDIKNEGTFETAFGDDLSCFRYRAWSPGHPRNKNGNEDCVALGADKSWRAIDCKRKLPFLCEIFPTTPEINFAVNTNCSVLPNKKRRNQCRSEQAKSHKSESENRCST